MGCGLYAICPSLRHHQANPSPHAELGELYFPSKITEVEVTKVVVATKFFWIDGCSTAFCAPSDHKRNPRERARPPISLIGSVCLWHLAGINADAEHFRYWELSGHRRANAKPRAGTQCFLR